MNLQERVKQRNVTPNFLRFRSMLVAIKGRVLRSARRLKRIRWRRRSQLNALSAVNAAPRRRADAVFRLTSDECFISANSVPPSSSRKSHRRQTKWITASQKHRHRRHQDQIMQWRATHQHRTRLRQNKHHPSENARQQETQLCLRESADEGSQRNFPNPQARGIALTWRGASEGDERGADAESDEEPIRTQLYQQTQDEEDRKQLKEETKAKDA